MKEARIQFLSLLKAGLWNNAIDLELFTNNIQWPKILNLAKEQAVLGIIFDSINMLPHDYQPSGEIMRKLFKITIEIERHNDILNQKLKEITMLLNENSIPSVLLKGQGLAQNYPIPEHRQSGDIDIYVGQLQYDKACQLILDKQIMTGEETRSKKHCHFSMDNIIVEIHKIAENLDNPQKNKAFQNWTLKNLGSDTKRLWDLKGTEIWLPPINFNAIYIFAHLFGHFIATGVGLRQISDWMLFLHVYNNEIDRNKLANDLKSFGLIYPWKCFGCILVKYLGLPKNEFPLFDEKHERTADIIMEEYILQDGNFGQYDKMGKNIRANNCRQKINKLKQRTSRVVRIFSLFPSHASFYYLSFLKRGFSHDSNH